jgi:outer membrane autotransporter protein
MNGLYLKPYTDFDLLYTNVPSFTESGAGSSDLTVKGQSQTSFGFSPNVEIGTHLKVGDAWTIRPFASVGATFLTSSKWVTEATLAGAPLGVGSFSSVTDLPNAMADLGFGVQVLNRNGLELRAELSSQISPNYLGEAGTLRLAYHF